MTVQSKNSGRVAHHNCTESSRPDLEKGKKDDSNNNIVEDPEEETKLHEKALSRENDLEVASNCERWLNDVMG